MGLRVLSAIVGLVLALTCAPAPAETFLDKVCKPGVTWQMCFNKCVERSGAGSKDVTNSCSGDARGWGANEVT
jgi:hypothetical protein